MLGLCLCASSAGVNCAAECTPVALTLSPLRSLWCVCECVCVRSSWTRAAPTGTDCRIPRKQSNGLGRSVDAPTPRGAARLCHEKRKTAIRSANSCAAPCLGTSPSPARANGWLGTVVRMGPIKRNSYSLLMRLRPFSDPLSRPCAVCRILKSDSSGVAVARWQVLTCKCVQNVPRRKLFQESFRLRCDDGSAVHRPGRQGCSPSPCGLHSPTPFLKASQRNLESANCQGEGPG